MDSSLISSLPLLTCVTSPFLSCYLPSGLRDQPKEPQNLCSPACPPSNAYRSSEALPSERPNKRDPVPKTSWFFHLLSSTSVDDLLPPDELPSFCDTPAHLLSLTI
ncbi:hypothetical protein ATANTOWER_022073 [Ataeniobius toweri]|uniref:Uncharacterized protein n=1 Tax=Ataeniobius toweri TaxID=208326 RepID=A0ABU7AI14_9TELE|nr:hypothetical protein [Ataeniobius toweri]